MSLRISRCVKHEKIDCMECKFLSFRRSLDRLIIYVDDMEDEMESNGLLDNFLPINGSLALRDYEHCKRLSDFLGSKIHIDT